MATSPLLTDLLEQVSRSFYKTMRILPPAIRPQISLAYLLARTTDTIADTQIVPVDKRLQALRAFRERLSGKNSQPLNFGELAKNQGSPGERVLLERNEEALALLNEFSPEDQQRIREVLSTILSGQELDLIRFSHAAESRILTLQTEGELDGYTYRVAGCVGEFWTKMCRTHLFPTAPLNDNLLIQNSVRFGKGLQLVNILRDLPSDLRQGRCYIPREKLVAASLKPEDLLDPANISRFRPVYDALLNQAHSNLRAGWDYTNALPQKQMRVRIACALPILIGVRTLQQLRKENVLEPSRRIKIGRGEVRSIFFGLFWKHYFPARWNAQFPHS
ncbi:MAG: squalene/phytoene synthase family protein [Verrucomicrobia bacterium]|nr:squalene/phytoene synthase family protein [Verrucomicrobiota bacterium]